MGDFQVAIREIIKNLYIASKIMSYADMVPFLQCRGSRPGLFYDLSAGESCPLRIPPTSRGLRFPPLISREKHGGLPPGTSEKAPYPLALFLFMKDAALFKS